MKHYRNEWAKYKNGLVTAGKAEKMSIHLSECDQCLEEFLALVDEQEISEAEISLDRGFTERVMKVVAAEKKKEKARKYADRAEKNKNSIIYYVAAASITLIFVGSGLFQAFVQGFAEPAALELSTKIIHDQRSYDFSGKIVNKASLWIENFESQRRDQDETKE